MEWRSIQSSSFSRDRHPRMHGSIQDALVKTTYPRIELEIKIRYIIFLTPLWL